MFAAGLAVAVALPAAAEPPRDRKQLPRPRLQALPELEPELTYRVHPPPPENGGARRISPSEAFRRELREEAIEYRQANPWAHASEELRGDRTVREARADAAEDMLSDAFEAGAEIVLRDLLRRPRRSDDDVLRTGYRAQLRVDTSPSLRIRRNAGMHSIRFEVPLSAHEPFEISCRRLSAAGRTPRRMGGAFALDPWHESVRFGFEFEY